MVPIINMVNNRAGKFGSNELREVLKPMFPSDYALELKHEVASFLAMGIEAIKNNGEVRGMSLQQAAT